MKMLKTARFGEIDADTLTCLHFEEGFPAFEKERDFALIPAAEDSPYVFMQSFLTPELAFLLTRPFLFFPDYHCELTDDVVEKLRLERDEDAVIYTLVTVPDGDVSRLSANLLAPIVVNKENGQARQIILETSGYTTKHRLFQEPKGGGE